MRGQAFQLLADTSRPTTSTNAYDLITSEREPTERRIRIAKTLEQTDPEHKAEEQRAGKTGTSQHYLDYLGPRRSLEYSAPVNPIPAPARRR